MNSNKTSDLAYDGLKKLFKGNVMRGLNFNTFMEYLSAVIDDLYNNIDLDCINLEDLGIKCPDPNISKQCYIINFLVANYQTLLSNYNTLVTTVNEINTNIGLFTDELVKIDEDDTPGFLIDKITSAPGVIVRKEGSLFIQGTVPIGFNACISKNRLGDFDGSGKGKADTDIWGWAIRNGNNGTDNILGKFPRYASDVNLAGAIAGVDNFIIEKKNIKSLSLPVTGSISNALGPLKPELKVSKVLYHFGAGAGHYVVDFPSGSDKTFILETMELGHTHNFSLSAAIDNPVPEPIELLPSHFTEIPIQRINP